MSVSNGANADQDTFNNAFVSKTADSTVVSVLTLSEPSSSSIPDLQAAVNAAKIFVSTGTLTIAAAGTIGASSESANQMLRVAGSGAAVTTAAEPFGTGTFVDGATIKIVGTDSTNTVTIENQDVAKGAILNGDATLLQYYILTLVYDATQDRFIEVSRNF